MNRRDIVIGLTVFALLGAFIYFRQKRIQDEERLRLPQTLSIEDRIEDAFKLEIPEDVDKAELKDVSGGNASGMATRKFEDEKFTHTVLADLPDPEEGSFYEGWLIRGEEGVDDYSFISTGKLKIAKGGYLLEFNSGNDFSDYSKVVVSLEKVADINPERQILEGEF